MDCSPFECPLCCRTYSSARGDQYPTFLACGHTLCTLCHSMIKTPSCPFCNKATIGTTQQPWFGFFGLLDGHLSKDAATSPAAAADDETVGETNGGESVSASDMNMNPCQRCFDAVFVGNIAEDFIDPLSVLRAYSRLLCSDCRFNLFCIDDDEEQEDAIICSISDEEGQEQIGRSDGGAPGITTTRSPVIINLVSDDEDGGTAFVSRASTVTIITGGTNTVIVGAPRAPGVVPQARRIHPDHRRRSYCPEGSPCVPCIKTLAFFNHRTDGTHKNPRQSCAFRPQKRTIPRSVTVTAPKKKPRYGSDGDDLSDEDWGDGVL